MKQQKKKLCENNTLINADLFSALNCVQLHLHKQIQYKKIHKSYTVFRSIWNGLVRDHIH